MKEIEVVVLEVGLDYVEKVDYFFMEVPEDRFQAVAKAIKAVKDRGYQVLHNDQGGNNEYIRVDCDEEYIAVTVVPSVEEGEE
jgi:hypothetical protein